MNAQGFQELAAVRMGGPSADVRSAAMGGALDAMAPRAASAFDNPAAVASSRRPVVSLGAARTSYAAEARSIGGGFPPFRYHDRLASSALSHFAVAMPVGPVTVAAYFVDEPRLHSGTSILSGGGLTAYSPLPEFDGYILSPQPGFDRSERRYGAAAAWRIGALDIGACAELQQLDERVGISRLFLVGFNGTAPDRLLRTTSGHAVVPNAGIIWHAAPRLAIGASYKGGGSFARTSTACGTADQGSASCDTAVAELNRTAQRMPSTMRVDATLQATSGLVLTAAAVRRDYSRFHRDPYGLVGAPVAFPYRDIIEKHAGAEYRIGRVALRTGWWLDPTHFRQPLYGASDFTKNVSHWTWGAGLNLGGSDFAFAIDDGGKHGGRAATIGLSRSF